MPISSGYWEPDAGLVFLAGGRLFVMDGALSVPLAGAPTGVVAVATLAGSHVAASVDGLYVQADGGWEQIVAHSGLRSLVSNGSRLASLTSDGGVFSYENGTATTISTVIRPTLLEIGSDGTLYGAAGSRLLVEDGGVLQEVMLPGPFIQALGHTPDGDLIYVRAPDVCSVRQNRCTRQFLVDVNTRLYPDVNGALAMPGIFGSLYLLSSIDSASEVRIPVLPTAVWAGGGGRIALGTDGGGVYLGGP